MNIIIHSNYPDNPSRQLSSITIFTSCRLSHGRPSATLSRYHLPLLLISQSRLGELQQTLGVLLLQRGPAYKQTTQNDKQTSKVGYSLKQVVGIKKPVLSDLVGTTKGGL